MPNQIIFKNNSLDLLQDYDHFILDIWGVIHDGSATYDGVVENLTKLKKAGKKIYFLSNAPRRSSKVIEVLAKFGITKEFYDFVMTSGEATHTFFEENQKKDFKDYGKNYYYIGPLKDRDLFSGLDYQEVAKISQADFALITGYDHDLSAVDEKLEDLKECKKHNLPLICVNPDLIVVKKSGQEILCGGLIARQYEDMEGKVVYFGKPFQSIYEQTFSLAKIKDKSKVLAIGDGIETDIKGANDSGIDSAFIGGGIMASRLNITHGQLPTREDLTKLCNYYQIYPKFILSQL